MSSEATLPDANLWLFVRGLSRRAGLLVRERLAWGEAVLTFSHVKT